MELENNIRNDLVIFLKLVKFSSYLGVMPCNTRKIKTLVTLIFFLTIHCVVSVFFGISKLKNETKVTFLVINSLQISLVFLYNCCSTCGCFINISKVEKLLKNFVEVDKLIEKRWYKPAIPKTINYRIIGYHTAFLLLHVQYLYTFIRMDVMVKLSLLCFVWFQYQMCLLVLIIILLENMISRRYNEFENIIKDKITQLRFPNIVTFDKDLNNLKKIHYLLYDGIQQSNVTFGLQILIITIMASIAVLSSFNEIVFGNSQDEGKWMLCLEIGSFLGVSMI